MLVCATLFWAGNFTIAKYAYLENIPPNTLAFLRWCLVWIILFPFTYKEILKLKYNIKKNEVAFLSANTWDVSGGGNYGFNSIWVNRNSNTFDNLDYVPKHQIKDLSKLLDII